MSTSKPSSRQQPRKKTKEQLKKEEEEQREQEQLERERSAEIARKPREFTDYGFVELVLQYGNDPDQLTELMARELKLHDYLVNLRSSILIDFHVHNVSFVKAQGFNLRQSSIFLHLLEQLRIMALEEDASVLKLTSFLKEKLMEHSRPLSLQEQEEWRLNNEKRAKQRESEREKSPNKKRVPVKPKKSDEEAKRLEEDEKRRQEEEEEKRRREEEVEQLSKSPAYNIDDVAAITDFIVSGLLQHYQLYRFVFGQEQPLEVTHYKSMIETLPEPSLPLADFLEEELYNQKKLEAQRQKEEQKEAIRLEKEERMKREAEEAEQRYQEELAAKRARMVQSGDVRQIAEFINNVVQVDSEGLKETYLAKLETIHTIVEGALATNTN